VSRGHWARTCCSGVRSVLGGELTAEEGHAGWALVGGAGGQDGGGEQGEAGLRQGDEVGRGFVSGRNLDRGRHLVVEAERAGREGNETSTSR
jgi:hypothetical protein